MLITLLSTGPVEPVHTGVEAPRGGRLRNPPTLISRGPEPKPVMSVKSR